MKLFLHNKQSGASLIEVLISIFILAFGMLALGVMSSFAVQMPKLSGYRATAANLAASYIERIRANPRAFSADKYDKFRSYDSSQSKLDIDQTKICHYPECDDENTLAALAIMDFEEMKVATRTALPAGGILMLRDSSSKTEGNLWIIWQEPSIYTSFNPASSGVDSPFVDNCPLEVTQNYPTPKPRCLYVRFRI